MLTACAGAIHLAMAPIHAGDARREATAFAVVGALQLLGAAWVLLDQKGTAPVAALDAVAATAWAWSRRWALAFDLGGPEDAGIVDGLTAGFEVVAVAAAIVGTSVPVRRLAPLHAVAVVGTVAALVAPSTADHGGHPGHHDGDDGTAAHGHVAGDCPEHAAVGDGRAGSALRFDGPRLSTAAQAALTSLAEASGPLPCGATATPHGHGDAAIEEAALSEPDLARFEEQWAAAQQAAIGLATPEQASAAGYVKAAPQTPGVGTHWIDWTSIDAPFDPARPSMLLFDERPGRVPRLAGFSYWSRSAPGAPDGFAGPNDVWHQHVGLCFVEGWLALENVPAASGCAGEWLNGSDLWMLHAWVAPGLSNPDGRFAGRHRALCPGDLEAGSDVFACEPVD